MLCPYCNIEYSAEQPCFCHPTLQTKYSEPEDGQAVRKISSNNVAWNAQRGVRLD